jgi:outer membrane protein assembly factor BamA
MKTLFPGFLARSLRTSLSLALLCVSAAAQTQRTSGTPPMPPSAYKLIAVKVTGSKRFTQEEIAAASGLPLGTIAHEEDFKKAARQLGESGAFNDVTYSFSYSSSGTKLEFQVTDAEKFVPARFVDFVWFTDEALLQKVRERIPLFHGEIPTTGTLPDEVSDVLQAVLVENGIPGHVEYVHSTSKAGHIDSIDYGVAGVSIRIRNFEFTGVGPAELPLLNTAATKFTDREYFHALLASFIDHDLLPIYHERGYLKAECAPPQTNVVKQPASDPTASAEPVTFVDITFAVTPGIPYKLAGWDWSGNKEIPSELFEPFLHAKVGQTANTVQLEDDLRGVQELYASRGYILAVVKANAEFDNHAATVIYHLAVQEGDLYRMGELQFRGIDNSLTSKLRALWKIRPGEVYDASYLKTFLPAARKLLPANLDWEVSTHVTALARDKTVDVDLQYTAKATQ